MTPKQFIEKAIEGGWKFGIDCSNAPNFKMYDYGFTFGIELKSDIHIDTIVLDPLAWAAIGKVEGWHENSQESKTVHVPSFPLKVWKWNMHRMIDALCEGKSIESFLETL